MARLFKTNVTSEGTITATTFSGSGASLTSLNGSNISSGTVADARIASTIARTTSPAITTSITTPSTSFDLLNTTATTVNAFGAAGTLNLATSAYDVNIGNTGTLGGYTQTVNLFTGTSSTGTNQTINLGTGNFGTASQTINIGTGTITSATRTINIGSTSGTGTTNIRGTVNHAGTTSPIQLNSVSGNTGQVLTSAGAGNTPTWTTPASHTLISSVAFTSAPSFTSIPQTYKRLYAVIVFATLGTFSGALIYSVNGAGTGYSRFQPGVSTTFTSSAGAAAVLTLAGTAPVVGDSYWVEINNYTQPNSRSIGSGSVYTFGNLIPAAVTSFAFGGSTTFGTATGTAYLYGVN